MNWKDAYEAQMETWKWVRTPDGRAQMFSVIDYDLLPDQSKAMFRALLRMEESKLLCADPIFVESEFCDLVESARKTFKPEPIHPQDFMTPQGFMYFQRPLSLSSRNPENPVLLTGASWTPMYFTDREGNHGRVYEGEDNPYRGFNAGEHESLAGVALTLYGLTIDGVEVEYAGRRIVFPKVIPVHFTPWYFGMTFEGNEVDAHGTPTAAREWWITLQVALRLMQQTITVHSEAPVDRATRRRAQRLGFKPREIVVVRLRRPKHQPTDTERSVAWSHRWVVHGFWRNQWFPSLKIHRQIYINDYIKGPDDMPLIVKNRAFQWER
jgi:hypothetical protein